MKRSPLKRKGKSKMSKLKARAWKAFSLFIRTRDRFICITCGKTGTGSFMNAGHYISRRHSSTMFDEKNVHAQCMNCNLWGYGNMGVYTLKLQEMYGPKIIEELTRKSREIKQFTPQELENLIHKYEGML